MAYQGVWCESHWNTAGYPLLSSSYHYNIHDVFVEAFLTETYEAQSNMDRDVAYVFEVPPEASVVQFSATVGTTKIEAIVEEKGKADKLYKDATSAGFEAWKLDKVNEEVFKISLGKVKKDEKIIINVTYVYTISSDTLTDTLRLTIPAGLAQRPHADATRTVQKPSPSATYPAVRIVVSIQAMQDSAVMEVKCVSEHKPTIVEGFADDSYKKMKTSKEKRQAKKDWKAYVELESKQFLDHHFVLSWQTDGADQVRCFEQEIETPTKDGRKTWATAMTVVSSRSIVEAEHEYIFLVDRSGSMTSTRTRIANDVVKEMLRWLPRKERSTFNIYNFNTSATSTIPGSKAVAFDDANVNQATASLSTYSSGGTDINAALTTVFRDRDVNKEHCSVIVLTDGLDWGVTTAMKTVQDNFKAASDRSKLLRVFVVGIGDDVSHGMCEALARSGAGATAYISDANNDGAISKAETMMRSIRRAPVRVTNVDWNYDLNLPDSTSGTNDDNDDARSDPGTPGPPPVKGENVTLPNKLQTPETGTLFWAIRSTWFAILNGKPSRSRNEAIVTYEIPGPSGTTTTTTKNYHVKRATLPPGRLLHSLAARARIQALEDKIWYLSQADRYYPEAEIIFLGKNYGLATSQTSFIATQNGVGTKTTVKANASLQNKSLLMSLPENSSSFKVATVGASDAGIQSHVAMPQGGFAMRMAVNRSSIQIPEVEEEEAAAEEAEEEGYEDDLAAILAAQARDGAFSAATVEKFVFPGMGLPESASSLDALEGNEQVKGKIWLAICVLAFFEVNHDDREGDWAEAKAKAEKFVKMNLHCIYGFEDDRASEIIAAALEEAKNLV